MRAGCDVNSARDADFRNCVCVLTPDFTLDTHARHSRQTLGQTLTSIVLEKVASEEYEKTKLWECARETASETPRISNTADTRYV